jgi:hypothetical protein
MLRSMFLEKNYLCNEVTQYIIFRISFCQKKTFVEFNYTIIARIRIKDWGKKHLCNETTQYQCYGQGFWEETMKLHNTKVKAKN